MGQAMMGPDGAIAIEYFKGEDHKAIEAQLDKRRAELEQKGHTFVRRFMIGRNEPCPCGSGLKFKKCCLHKAVDVP